METSPVNVTKARDGGIDLLRIIMTVGVVFLHYNNESIGKALLYTRDSLQNNIFLLIVEVLFVPAVDIFVLISGYLSVRRCNVKFSRGVEMTAEVIICQVLSGVIVKIARQSHISISDFMRWLVPTNWYVVLFIALYYLSPFINVTLSRISTKSIVTLNFMLLLLFAIEPTIVRLLEKLIGRTINGLSMIGMYGNQYGYTIVNFVVLYIIGATIRLVPLSNTAHIERAFVAVFLLNIVLFVCEYNTCFSPYIMMDYCNPLIIAQAISFFLLVKNIKCRSKVVSYIARGCFPVYLLHATFLELFPIDRIAGKSLFYVIVNSIGTCILIFCVCFIIGIIYKSVGTYITKIIRAKIEYTDFNIFVE